MYRVRTTINRRFCYIRDANSYVEGFSWFAIQEIQEHLSLLYESIAEHGHVMVLAKLEILNC